MKGYILKCQLILLQATDSQILMQATDIYLHTSNSDAMGQLLFLQATDSQLRQ
jgi:hypothetical protein